MNKDSNFLKILKVCNLKSNHLKIDSKTIKSEKCLQEEKKKNIT